jgi:hypothetical protein
MKSKELLPSAAAISFFALNAHAQTPAQLQGVDHGSQRPSHRLETAIQIRRWLKLLGFGSQFNNSKSNFRIHQMIKELHP